MTKTSPKFPVSIGLNVTREQKRRWSSAAKTDKRSLAAWIRRTLDERLHELELDWEPQEEEEAEVFFADPFPAGEIDFVLEPTDVPSTLPPAGGVKDQDGRSSSKPPSVPELEDAPSPASAELPPASLLPSCHLADAHWRIPSGLACPACRGVAP